MLVSINIRREKTRGLIHRWNPKKFEYHPKIKKISFQRFDIITNCHNENDNM